MPDIREFTPGPWVSNGQMVCSKAAPQRTFGDNGEYSADFIVTQTALYTSANSKEANANARLIAAAPELLDALENMLNYLETDDMRPLNMNLARAAISKARGL